MFDLGRKVFAASKYAQRSRIMADILLNSELLAIGSDDLPNGLVNKYITLSNVKVTGTASMPEATTSLRLGDPGKITEKTVIESVNAIVDPESIKVDNDEQDVRFQVILQASFRTGSNSYLETKKYTASAHVRLSGDMSEFALDTSVKPFIKHIGAPAIQPAKDAPDTYELEIPVTTGAFIVSASGLANVRVPLSVAENFI